MYIHIVIGTRPNFIKAAPLCWAAKKIGIKIHLIHTGQHYDLLMNQVFFDDLDLPRPYRYLDIGSGSHAKSTGRCLERLGNVFSEDKPDWVIVIGDVNSTIAGALAAVKLGIKCAHVESGLRSFDRTMPEEINRIATDSISDLLFATEPSGVTNLEHEGHSPGSIKLVGNVIIDTLDHFLPIARKRGAFNLFDLKVKNYALLTLHRQSNVDIDSSLKALIDKIDLVQQLIPVVFPVHPRTRKELHSFGFENRLEKLSNLKIVDPLGYVDFLSLMGNSKMVITDSGGIQEETTVLEIPCLTLRDNTERPITCEQGTNQLVGSTGSKLMSAIESVMNNEQKIIKRPDLWDGHTAERILNELTIGKIS